MEPKFSVGDDVVIILGGHMFNGEQGTVIAVSIPNKCEKFYEYLVISENMTGRGIWYGASEIVKMKAVDFTLYDAPAFPGGDAGIFPAAHIRPEYVECSECGAILDNHGRCWHCDYTDDEVDAMLDNEPARPETLDSEYDVFLDTLNTAPEMDSDTIEVGDIVIDIDTNDPRSETLGYVGIVVKVDGNDTENAPYLVQFNSAWKGVGMTHWYSRDGVKLLDIANLPSNNPDYQFPTDETIERLTGLVVSYERVTDGQADTIYRQQQEIKALKQEIYELTVGKQPNLPPYTRYTGNNFSPEGW